MSTVNAEVVIAALENIAKQLEGKELATVKVATTRRRVKSLMDQVKSQAVEPPTPEPAEWGALGDPEPDKNGIELWSILCTKDPTPEIYPMPGKLTATFLAELCPDCQVVPGWPATAFSKKVD